MSNDFVVKDSGERQEFESGMVRDTQEDKPRPDLISPFFEDRLGMHLARGAKKYAERNWEKGAKFSRFVASLKRHYTAYLRGDKDEDHLSAMAFNIMCIVHFEELGRSDLDDLPRYEKRVGEDVVRKEEISAAAVETADRIISELKERCKARKAPTKRVVDYINEQNIASKTRAMAENEADREMTRRIMEEEADEEIRREEDLAEENPL